MDKEIIWLMESAVTMEESMDDPNEDWLQRAYRWLAKHNGLELGEEYD